MRHLCARRVFITPDDGSKYAPHDGAFNEVADTDLEALRSWFSCDNDEDWLRAF